MRVARPKKPVVTLTNPVRMVTMMTNWSPSTVYGAGTTRTMPPADWWRRHPGPPCVVRRHEVPDGPRVLILLACRPCREVYVVDEVRIP